MKEIGIPGVALAIVHGDQIVYLKGFGIADPSGRPMTAQTPVMLASLAKPMTGLAIMQLVEAGQIDLDAPVQRYLPWFRVADEVASARITVRHLLYHTSGLPELAGAEYGWNGDNRADALEQQVSGLATVDLIDPVEQRTTTATPTTEYCAVDPKRLQANPTKRTCSHTFSTRWKCARPFSRRSLAQPHGLAQGYRFVFGQPLPFVEPFDRGGVASGGIIASAEDVAKFVIVNLNDGRYGDVDLVSARGIVEMQRPVVPLGDDMEAWDWHVMSTEGTTVLTKGGDLASYKTNMALFPESKWGFVVLINGSDRFAAFLGDARIPGIAIGLNNLMVGQQPPNLASNGPIIYRLFVTLVLVVQLAEIIRSMMTLRRWQQQPARRPRGLWGHVRSIILPLIGSIAWGLLLLVGVPTLMGGYPLSFLMYMTPDLGFFLIVSGGVALVWGVLRTALAFFTLRGAKHDEHVVAQMPALAQK